MPSSFMDSACVLINAICCASHKENPIKVNHFTTIESEYGRFIVNRHCAYQADVLIKTGKPHIQNELNQILPIVDTLPDNSVVIDAGANIGLVSLPMAQRVKNKQGRVYAFEVQRMLFYALCGTAALNDQDNLFAYHQGLGAQAGSIACDTLDYSQPQDFGLFSLVDKLAVKDSHPTSESVSITTIDSLGLAQLDFLKIDVEGMEIDVLKGARSMLDQFSPWCWIEYWKVDVEAIKAQFAGLDYTFYRMDQLNMLCAPKERLEKAPLAINAQTM